jgi:hypothetical protein
LLAVVFHRWSSCAIHCSIIEFCSIFVLLTTGVFTEVVVGVQAWHGEHGIDVDVSGQRGSMESGAQGSEIEHGACADIKSEMWKRVLISTKKGVYKDGIKRI